MAYWSVDYNKPKKGWIEVKKFAKKGEAEDFIKGSEEGLIRPNTKIGELAEKFRLKKMKGNLK